MKIRCSQEPVIPATSWATTLDFTTPDIKGSTTLSGIILHEWDVGAAGATNTQWADQAGNRPLATAGGSTTVVFNADTRTLRLGRDSILAYRYWMIYGHLDTIRERVYELHEFYPNG